MLASGLAGVSRACGPDFPNLYLGLSTKEVLHPPPGSFRYELGRLESPEGRPARVMALPVDRDPSSTGRLDVAELEKFVSGKGDDLRSAEIVRRYAAFRGWLLDAREHPPHSQPPELSKDTPEAFALYLRGAAAWQRKDYEGARGAWQAVLDLQPDGNPRFTWALYMLGLDCLHRAENPAGRLAATTEAIKCFRGVREAKAEGCADSLDLADASYGREAQCYLLRDDYVQAIHLYLEGYAHDDDSSVRSLYVTAQKAAAVMEEGRMRAIALDPRAREVVAVFLATDADGANGAEVDSAGWRDQRAAWAQAFEAAGVTNERCAGPLAWVAYEGADWSQAFRWASIAGESSPQGDWVLAKLSLRKGDLADAQRRLTRVASSPLMSGEDRDLACAELGRVRLAMDDPQGALAAMLAGDHWRDAAYIAERLLSVPELRQYVDANSHFTELVGSKNENLKALRALLARRLLRSGSGEARFYFDDAAVGYYWAYVEGLRDGFDPTKTEGQRARALWQAARCLHEHGMELMGTELEPDFAVFGGDFEFEPLQAARENLKGDLLGPSGNELKRLEATPMPVKRWHYRYKAAEIALLAASLMPNDSEETARVLWTGANWIKRTDPKAANPFYQQLVVRCPHTELGRQALLLHWFPVNGPVPENEGT